MSKNYWSKRFECINKYVEYMCILSMSSSRSMKIKRKLCVFNRIIDEIPINSASLFVLEIKKERKKTIE